MRSIAVVLPVALAALLLAREPAQALCADELSALQARVDRAQKMHPPPPGAAAAAKVLQKFNESDSQDEVDCFNAVAKARRALNSPPEAAGTTLQPGQRQEPVGTAVQAPK